ncbi:hypothetical protein HPB52_014151 [Rhipicephalus sanguineus]|uniref:Uncharacterized protein n=1 Tax=Rhipicephalus sanguineus TaxID=34632 RepID=A0A9D4SSD5_RHISA|nr:hypothetical protein HPB52_014151 [Rhipicephalus sanguineus]
MVGACPAVARATEKASVKVVKTLYRNFLSPLGNVDVIFDGTWKTRGHNSNIAVGCIIELYTGLVLDHVGLLRYCRGCRGAPDPSDGGYGDWAVNHKCLKNIDCNAGRMEVEAALILFRHSLDKNGLRYTTILSDGDSRTFHALNEESVYGYIDIEKKDGLNHVIRDMLSELRASGDSRPDGSCYEAMLGLALRSDDETFHASLYDWLCESGQSARLLDVRSPFLEAYLQRRCDAADLLWKYHERVGNYGAAARILAKLADRPGTDVNLAKRLEYLARAIVCIKSTHFQVTNEGNFLYQLEEKLEVARLQAKVQDALRQRSDLPMAAELVARLDAELVDVTHLYGDYADPYDLAECKLAIVRSSGYDKPLLVESLWQSLLEREFLNNVRPDQLSQRLESLAQDYAQSEKFFPLAFLVKFLELRGSQHGFEPGWILEPLLGANVPISRLRDTYNDLYRGKDPAFTERSLHLLHAIARLLELFLNGCHCTDRRRLANRCINDIPGYLVDLQSMATRDNAVDSLISKFKEFQARLDRYVAA